MSLANEMLNGMNPDEVSTYAADPTTEEHIVIGSDRFIKVPAALKRIAVQYDHNIETVTFDCPRYWDGVDMSAMFIYINYRLPNGDLGSYIADNVVVDDTDETMMHFNWTISKNVTMHKGNISFLVCIKKTDADGNEENHWNSELNKDMYVSEGLECVEDIISIYPDIVTQILTLIGSMKGFEDERLIELKHEGLFHAEDKYITAVNGLSYMGGLDSYTSDITVTVDSNSIGKDGITFKTCGKNLYKNTFAPSESMYNFTGGPNGAYHFKGYDDGSWDITMDTTKYTHSELINQDYGDQGWPLSRMQGYGMKLPAGRYILSGSGFAEGGGSYVKADVYDIDANLINTFKNYKDQETEIILESPGEICIGCVFYEEAGDEIIHVICTPMLSIEGGEFEPYIEGETITSHSETTTLKPIYPRMTIYNEQFISMQVEYTPGYGIVDQIKELMKYLSPTPTSLYAPIKKGSTELSLVGGDIDKNKAIGKGAIAFGYSGTRAEGNGAFVAGMLDTAAYPNGVRNINGVDYAVGAIGAATVSMGGSNIAASTAAASFGAHCASLATRSFTSGHHSWVLPEHEDAVAMGKYLRTGAKWQAIFGGYNKPNANALFQVGAGASDTNRANAFEVGKENDEYCMMVGNTKITETQLKALLNLLN